MINFDIICECKFLCKLIDCKAKERTGQTINNPKVKLYYRKRLNPILDQ